MPSQRFSSLRNSVNGALEGKIGNFFFAGGGGGKEHGSGPLKSSRQRHGAVTRLPPLALKVTKIVYNPPFEKFLDPPQKFKQKDIGKRLKRFQGKFRAAMS